MLDSLNKSLSKRLLFSFIIIGFLPFVIFLIYTLVLSETKIVDKLILDQHHQASQISKFMNTHLLSLDKEVAFLSRLDLMDDILAEDIDKRISRLLKQKKDDYNLKLNFFVINDKGQIIASSDKNIILTKFPLQDKLNKNTKKFFLDKKLYIYSKVFASFDKNKNLGYLILEYDLENLNNYLDHTLNAYAYIKNNNIVIGDKAPFDISINSEKDSISLDDYIVVYQKMDSILEEWYVFYVVKKEIALEFFYNFIHFMLYLSPFIIILTIFVSLKFSKYIVKPIEDLTQVTDEIILSKDYSKLLYMSSSDEVGRLAHSFNILLNTTDKTLYASEAKSSFISNMSHELKTPLNAIIGFSQYLISYEKLTDEQLDIVSNIENSSQYLLEMIYGILDIAKIEAGKLETDIKELDCLSLSKECFSMLEPLAYDKGLKFELKTKDYSLNFFKTDEKIFKQILINLLSNAIKYTKEGKVVLELTNTKDKFFVKVIDTGIGIKKEEMGKLFKEFTRIGNSLSSKQKGTGLGLSLSKKLSHIIDGDIYLESEGINCGTRANFVLRLKD